MLIFANEDSYRSSRMFRARRISPLGHGRTTTDSPSSGERTCRRRVVTLRDRPSDTCGRSSNTSATKKVITQVQCRRNYGNSKRCTATGKPHRAFRTPRSIIRSPSSSRRCHWRPQSRNHSRGFRSTSFGSSSVVSRRSGIWLSS